MTPMPSLLPMTSLRKRWRKVCVVRSRLPDRNGAKLNGGGPSTPGGNWTTPSKNRFAALLTMSSVTLPGARAPASGSASISITTVLQGSMYAIPRVSASFILTNGVPSEHREDSALARWKSNGSLKVPAHDNVKARAHSRTRARYRSSATSRSLRRRVIDSRCAGTAVRRDSWLRASPRCGAPVGPRTRSCAPVSHRGLGRDCTSTCASESTLSRVEASNLSGSRVRLRWLALLRALF